MNRLSQRASIVEATARKLYDEQNLNGNSMSLPEARELAEIAFKVIEPGFRSYLAEAIEAFQLKQDSASATYWLTLVADRIADGTL